MRRFLETPPHAKPLPPRPPPAALASPAQEAAEAGWRDLRGSPPGLSMMPPSHRSPSALPSGDGTRPSGESLSSSGRALPIAPPCPPPRESKAAFGGTASVSLGHSAHSNPGAFIIAETRGKDGRLPKAAGAWANGYKQLGWGQLCSSRPTSRGWEQPDA